MRPEAGVAIVTGASSGIGRAIAEVLAHDGETVGLVGRRPEALEEVAGLVERRGARAVCLVQALRALANRLRDEVNPAGIRVLGVYPGRTATPMQAAILQREGRPYRPERLLQPEHVAAVVLHGLAMPPGAEVTDISIRPMQKP